MEPAISSEASRCFHFRQNCDQDVTANKICVNYRGTIEEDAKQERWTFDQNCPRSPYQAFERRALWSSIVGLSASRA